MARTRGVRKARTTDIASVEALAQELIKENQRLRRQIAKTAASGVADLRGLAGLIRRVERGLLEVASARTGNGQSGKRRTRTPKPVSEATRQRRIAALAKARAKRALNAQSKLIEIQETGTSQPEAE